MYFIFFVHQSGHKPTQEFGCPTRNPQTNPWLLEDKSEIVETVINVLLLIASMAMCNQVPIVIVTIFNMVVYDFGHA
jgi:hypothetical protein